MSEVIREILPFLVILSIVFCVIIGVPDVTLWLCGAMTFTAMNDRCPIRSS